MASSDLTRNVVTTDKINAGAITGAKIAQAGATNGEALQMERNHPGAGSRRHWGSSSDWTYDGTTIRLNTSADSVQIGSVSKSNLCIQFNTIVEWNLGTGHFGSAQCKIWDLKFEPWNLSLETFSIRLHFNL